MLVYEIFWIYGDILFPKVFPQGSIKKKHKLRMFYFSRYFSRISKIIFYVPPRSRFLPRTKDKTRKLHRYVEYNYIATEVKFKHWQRGVV